jgi:hypothetical protein
LLKIVASDVFPVRNVTIELFEELFGEELWMNTAAAAASLGVIAHAVVRILESFLYSDIVTEQQRDVDRAVQLVTLLIPEDSGRSEPARTARSRTGVPRQARGRDHDRSPTCDR